MNRQESNFMFVNPICKDTYNSLPKIYGGPKSNRSVSRTKKNILFPARHSCLQKIDKQLKVQIKKQDKKSPNRHFSLIKSRFLSMPKGRKCNKQGCLCSSLHEQDPKTIRKHRSTVSPRKVKTKLKPIESHSKPDDFESEHKVAIRTSSQTNLPNGLSSMVSLSKLKSIVGMKNKKRHNSKQDINTSFIDQLNDQIDGKVTKRSRKVHESNVHMKKKSDLHNKDQNEQVNIPHSYTEEIANRTSNQNESKQISEFASRDSLLNSFNPQKSVACVEIQVNLLDDRETGIASQTNESPSLREKVNREKYKKKFVTKKGRYESSENQNSESESQQRQQTQQKSKNKEIKHNMTQSRQTNSSLSLSSCLLKGLGQNSTQFKKLNLREGQAYLRHSRAKSVNSNGTFRVPIQSEYADYLRSYKVMDKKNFNLKQLVKKELFTIVEQDEGVFFGQYKDANKCGNGIHVSQKQIFEGIYDNNIKIKGCQRNIDGIYKGYFLNGKREGYGTFEWNNGQKFEGNWKNGVKSGFGIWRSPRGDYYEGEWHNNRQQGDGIFKHKNSTYKGQFLNFLKHGKGEQRFANGDIYIGEYIQGKPEGIGNYKWNDGSHYEGQFRKGMRHGHGIWHEHSGNVYEGEFENDFIHGRGKLQFKTGGYFQGIFEKGNQLKGVLTNAEGVEEQIDNQQQVEEDKHQ